MDTPNLMPYEAHRLNLRRADLDRTLRLAFEEMGGGTANDYSDWVFGTSRNEDSEVHAAAVEVLALQEEMSYLPKNGVASLLLKSLASSDALGYFEALRKAARDFDPDRPKAVPNDAFERLERSVQNDPTLSAAVKLLAPLLAIDLDVHDAHEVAQSLITFFERFGIDRVKLITREERAVLVALDVNVSLPDAKILTTLVVDRPEDFCNGVWGLDDADGAILHGLLSKPAVIDVLSRVDSDALDAFLSEIDDGVPGAESLMDLYFVKPAQSVDAPAL